MTIEPLDNNSNIIENITTNENITNKNLSNKFVSKCETKQYNKTMAENLINYNDYFNKNISLTSFKIPELKKIAKHNNLYVSGTKPILIERIVAHFNKTKQCIKIQTYFRGWMVRFAFKLRGPAFKNRKLCVNDTDFITMEPIEEISHENFYSYTDAKNFTYGFDIASLIQCLNKKGKLDNPYNRERMINSITDNIKKIYQLCFIIFPEFKHTNQRLITAQTSRPRIQVPYNRNNTNNFIYNHDQQNRIIRLIENRNRTLDQRITSLFLEIDQLGNYTQVSWFNSLNTNGFIRLYRHLYDIWYLRSQMPREVRYNICPFPNLFSERSVTGLDYSQVKVACIEIFENLVFTGTDDEYRRLGALHALTALTIVSSGARESLPWLYDSIALY